MTGSATTGYGPTLRSSPIQSAIDILNKACREITRAGIEPVLDGRERELHLRLAAALEDHQPIREGRLSDHGRCWTRKPGGIDVVATGLALGIEAKLGKPDELLWDAIKIGQRVRPGGTWDGSLAAAALVVQISAEAARSESAYILWPAVQTKYDVAVLLKEHREDWYSLMCGGRGVRPTSLPCFLSASKTHLHRYESHTEMLLAVRSFAVPNSHRSDRITLDKQGWPDGTDIPSAWRDRIDECAARKPSSELVGAIPQLRQPRVEDYAEIEHRELLKGEGSRIWAFVWAAGLTKPTAFRLCPENTTRYEIRVSANRAVTITAAPVVLPAWSRTSIDAALNALP